MQMLRIVSNTLAENSYLMVPTDGQEALVVDPGVGVAQRLEPVLQELGVTVGAILLTHAHPDHAWDCAQIQDQYGADIAVYVPSPDVYRLEDPVGALGVGNAIDAFAPELVGSWRKPQNITDLPADLLSGGGASLMAGITLRALPAPGHSEGSTIYLGHGKAVDNHQNLGLENEAKPFMFAGDVIFSGSVGRTDLAGGDYEQMQETIRTCKQVIAPQTVILPGHGPATTWAKELTSNPFIV